MTLSFRSTLITLLLTGGLVACGNAVVAGGSSGSGGSGGGTTTTATSSSSGGTGGAGTGGSGTGGSHKPSAIVYGVDTVTVRVSSELLSCSDPGKAPPFDKCDWFTYEITMPKELLKVGTLDLGSTSEVSVFMQEALPANGSDPTDCGGTGAISGGGQGVSYGLLDITAITVAGLDFTLSDTFVSSDHDANGTYSAPRCD